MCIVSMMSDYYHNQWPKRFPDNPQPFQDQESKDLLKKVLKLLDRLDKRLGDVECKDAIKEAWLKEMAGGKAT